jgi:type VI protein secretion system component Hcp
MEADAIPFHAMPAARREGRRFLVGIGSSFPSLRRTRKNPNDRIEPGGLMKKLALAFLLCMLCAVGAHASDILVLTVNGVNCTTTTISGITAGVELDAWQWGAGTTVTGSNGGVISLGKPSLAFLSLTKPTNKCSSAYLDLNLTGKVLSTVTVTQYSINAVGKYTPQMVVTLTTAALTGYQVSGSTSGDPEESLSFAFQKICLTNNVNNTSACYSGAGL